MLDAFLVPEQTVITAAGEGAAVDLGGASEQHLLFTLTVEKIVEQESLDVQILGSQDGTTWLPKPLGTFPQVFYPTEQNLLIDLTAQPAVRFVKAKWLPNRWGVGSHVPWFSFNVRAREVPAEMVTERQRLSGKHSRSTAKA
jgi:hypothetical protein